MPVYSVRLSDGTEYEVEAPKGASEFALRAAAERYARQKELRAANERLAALRAAPATEAPAPKTTFGGNVWEGLKGVIPGAAGLVETAGTGISALLPEEQEKSVRQTLRSLREGISAPFAPEAGYEESVGRKFGQALGSTLPFFALGPLGLAGRIAGTGVGVAAGAGEARQRAEEKGVTGEERGLATALGAPTGLLDMLAPGMGGAIQNIVMRAFARGGIEGATEAAQQIAQNLIAKGIYDPSQGILAGSGEEGAYGAGVGALASLIIDASPLGRRARYGATPAQPPAALAQPPAQQVAPETGLMAPVPPTAEFPQGELFRQDITAARRQRAAEVPGRPEFELTPPEPAPPMTQMELPLGEPAAPVGMPQGMPQQRDMIDEMETQQARELIDQDETRQIEQMVLEDARREEQARAEQERLKFESDLAETDARRMEAERKRTEDHRLEILRTIIDTPTVKNIQATFGDALKVAGYTDTNFTPRERALIDRATSMQAAEPAAAPAPATEQIPAAPAELGGMEAAIPERTEAREPQQLGIPGIGKREAPAMAEPAPAPEPQFPTVLTSEVLDRTGLPRQSGFYRQLLNKDMADPAQQPAVRDVLVKVRTNPNVSPATKEALERVAMQAFGGLAKQAEMFGPRGGALPTAGGRKRADTGIEPTGLGAGPAPVQPRVPSGQAPTAVAPSAPVAQAPRPAGLVPSGEPAGRAVGREKPVPAPVEAKREKPVAAPAAPAVQAPAAPAVEAPAAPKPAKAVTPKKKTKKQEFEEDAQAGYMLVAKGDFDKALDYLAHDMAYAMYPEKDVAQRLNEITLNLVSDRIVKPRFSKRDEVYAPNTGGKYAEAFFNSLTPQQYKQLTAKLRNIFQTYAAQESAMNMLNEQQRRIRDDELGRNTQTKYGLDLEAPVLGMRMHPAMQERLDIGDVAGALRILAGLSEGRLSTMATRVADNIGATKVVLADDVKNESGKSVAGRYDPKTDTITMNTSMGMSSHTLLHEAVHAVTSHILANPSHPITRQLTALYKDAVPYLDTAYGARSLDEFVAEAFSNPQFQEKLSGIPAQGNTTIFGRFVRAVQNLVRRVLGMDAKPVESVMDATDRLVMEIMSPAPEFRGAGALYAASATGNPGHPLDVYGANAMRAPTLNEERVYKFREFFTGTAPEKAKEGLLATLPLNALVDVTKTRIPMADQIGNLVDERAGTENKRNQLIEPIVKRTAEWAAANGAKIDTLNSVIYNSTLYQVDPSKPRSEYANKVDDSGNKLDDVWDMLAPKWQSLGEDGRSVYKQMRDTYAALHNEIERVLFNRIDAALKDDPETAKKTKREIYERLFARGKIEPYFPLTRTGKYWLSYNANGEFYVEAFETAAMREDAIKELSKESGVSDVQKFASSSQINYRNVPSTSFVNNILQTLEAGKKGASPEAKERIDDAVNEVMNLFLNTLPETSFAQAMRRRKGTLGFNQDAVRALQSKTYNISRQLANIEYGAKLENARAEMEKHVKTNGNQEADVRYMNEFNKRIDFAISPNIPMWSKAATSFGFAMTLGFNLSSAIVNLAQIPVVVMPYLGGRYGYSNTTTAIGRATKVFMASGLSREAEMLVPVKDDKGNETEKSLTVRAAPSMDNYDFSDPKNKDIKHLETLVKIAGSRGQLNRSLAYDVLEVDERESMTAKVNKYSGFVFHHGERMNRQIALIAAYELELERLNKAGAKLEDGRSASTLSDAQKEEYAANQAIYLTELTNGGTAAAAAPRIAQNGIGRVLFMYKRYGVSMYYMLFKTAKDAMKNADPEVRKAAMRQIGGIYGSAALMAGLQGVPLYGIASVIFNLFRDDDEDDFDTVMRKSMPTWAFSGMVNELTGLDIASRIGMGDLLFRDSLVKNKEGYIGPLMEQLGGPVFGVASRMERGIQLINDGNVRRGIEQMLPSAFSALGKAERFAREGALTLRGDPITGEFGATQLAAQALGFTPASYIQQLEKNAAEKAKDRAANEDRTKLLRKYYVALRNGDSEGAQKVAEKMQEFNQKHPMLAITGDTVRSSLAQHMKTSQQMIGGVLYSTKMRPYAMQELQKYGGEYDSDEEE